MKYLLSIVLALLIFSCEKKENVIVSSDKSENVSEVPSNENDPDKFRAMACIINDKKGTKCVVAAWSTSTCTKATDCVSTPENILNAYFTAEELDNWENLDFSNSEFISNHYNYFLYLYNEGITLHPDEMILNLNN